MNEHLEKIKTYLLDIVKRPIVDGIIASAIFLMVSIWTRNILGIIGFSTSTTLLFIITYKYQCKS